MDAPASLVQRIQSEAARLTQYLHTLAPDAWIRPSACDRWEVRDVVGHLTWVAEFYVDTISRGVHGDISLRADRPPGDGPEAAAMNAYIAQRAVAWRERLGEQLLPTFRTRYEQLHHLLVGLSPQDWDKPCAFWRFMGNIPVRAFLPLAMQELAIHGWDIRSQLETTAPLSAESLSVLMARIPVRFGVPGYADFRLDAQAPAPVRYRFALSGVVPSTHDIVVENAKARMEPASTTTPHVTFRCETDIFVLMMYRRLTLEPVLVAGQLVVEGDQGLAMAFDQWLKGA
jgi:uncharacterized protein (TIGR03083 family)